jgi:hypothetical protein
VVNQTLSNVQVVGADLNVVAGNLIQVHHHHYLGVAKSSVVPAILDTVPNFRGIQIATLGQATPGTGDWICEWREWYIWLARDGSIRILWGFGIRELLFRLL